MKKKCFVICLLILTSAMFLNALNYGDVDLSGTIDVIDSLLVAQYYVGLGDISDLNAADVDNDGIVTIVDALWIARYYVGLVDRFPAEDVILPEVEVLSSAISRDMEPQVSGAEFEIMVDGINQFGYELYQQIKTSEANVFFSPVSISYAFAMASAGAMGKTKTEIFNTMHFPADESLHRSFNNLELKITTASSKVDEYSGDDLIVRLANSAWGQKDYYFVPDFLDVLALNYGAGMNLLDFTSAPEPSRLAINNWVADQTEDMINDLLPPGAINEVTRLVLTNAIYFNANWFTKFKPENTVPDIFYNLDGTSSSVPMMHQNELSNYYDGGTYQMLVKNYQGTKKSAMYIIMPVEGQFGAVETELSADFFDSARSMVSRYLVEISMPKFDYSWKNSIKNDLTALGMNDAFLPNLADFSSINGLHNLSIGDVFHEAAISLDEEGTEASAATAIIWAESSIPNLATMNINRPFIYLIRNEDTGVILFMGKVEKL